MPPYQDFSNKPAFVKFVETIQKREEFRCNYFFVMLMERWGFLRSILSTIVGDGLTQDELSKLNHVHTYSFAAPRRSSEKLYSVGYAIHKGHNLMAVRNIRTIIINWKQLAWPSILRAAAAVADYQAEALFAYLMHACHELSFAPEENLIQFAEDASSAIGTELLKRW
jgi:hypothetical protein